MVLLAGVHHLTTLTADLDRLIGFYRRVFDARVILDLDEEGLRHAFIESVRARSCTPSRCPESTCRRARSRCSSGAVTDMGSLLHFGFTDPDGASHEVVWVKPGIPVERGLRRAEWTTVDIEEGVRQHRLAALLRSTGAQPVLPGVNASGGRRAMTHPRNR